MSKDKFQFFNFSTVWFDLGFDLGFDIGLGSELGIGHLYLSLIFANLFDQQMISRNLSERDEFAYSQHYNQ